jgi:hypothetical protein
MLRNWNQNVACFSTRGQIVCGAAAYLHLCLLLLLLLLLLATFDDL